MRYGNYVSLDRDDPNVLAFLRKNPGNGESVLVVLNMSAEERTVKLDLAPQGVKRASAKVLLSSPEIDKDAVPLADLKVAPFGLFIGSVH